MSDSTLTDALEIGISRGWDHANFVNAYGREHERRTIDYPAWLAPDVTHVYGPDTCSPERQVARDEFKRGWALGRRRFSRGQWQDGSTSVDQA